MRSIFGPIEIVKQKNENLILKFIHKRQTNCTEKFSFGTKNVNSKLSRRKMKKSGKKKQTKRKVLSKTKQQYLKKKIQTTPRSLLMEKTKLYEFLFWGMLSTWETRISDSEW